MTKFALLAFTLAPLVAAQNANKQAPEPIVTKVIHVRYASAETLRDLLPPSVNAVSNNALRAVVLRGTDANIAAAEQIIKELDVPQQRSDGDRDVELTVYVIGAGPQPGDNGQPAPGLETVIRQLKAIFPYANYEPLDSMLIRAREPGMAQTDGLLRSFPNSKAGSENGYSISFGLLPPIRHTMT